MRHVLGRDLHRVAGLRVAPDAAGPVMQREAAEAADLDAIALGERIRNLIEHELDRQLHILVHQMGLLEGQPFNQFRLGHAGVCRVVRVGD